ncbi:OmpW/AlkL family protein [Ralstonia nicotianae]
MAYKKALAAAAGMILATAAHAQSAGSNIVSLGWFRVMPNSSSDPLQIDSVGGVPLNRSVPNTGAKIKDADTLGLAFTHFFTDNLAVELVGGIPPRHKIEGTDSFARYGQIGSAKQWSPTVLAKWYTTLANGQHAVTEAKIKINPIVTFLSVGYRF